MTDEELVAAFESATLDGALFTHEAHVRVAWHCLREEPFSEALARFSKALRRYAAHLGAPDKYHETVTVAFMAIIAGRIDDAQRTGWPAFRTANPDLFAKEPSVLSKYYSPATLQSDRAKRTFALPDRLPKL